MQVVLVYYLQSFRRNSVLKCALHPKIAKNLLKPLLGERGFKVIDVENLESLSPARPMVLVMISSMDLPICNRFHTIRANNGK